MYNNRGNRDYLIQSTGRGGNGQSRRALDGATNQKTFDLKKMTRSTSLYGLQDTQHQLFIFPTKQWRPIFMMFF